jgi:hypothetical protein
MLFALNRTMEIRKPAACASPKLDLACVFNRHTPNSVQKSAQNKVQSNSLMTCRRHFDDEGAAQ